MLRDLGHAVTEHEVGFPAVAANSYLVRYLTGVAECLPLVDRPEAVSSRTRQMARLGRRLERARPWAVRTLYESGRRIPRFAPWNATGQPAISIPAGFSELGLPVSVQLAGRTHDEATLLQLAHQLEVARPWDGRRPPLAL